MILFIEFMSNTSGIDIALKFAKKDGLLFEIEVPNEANLKISSIENISEFKHEKEILLSSGSILQYKGISQGIEPITIKFCLVESNTKAFSNFIVWSC